MSGPGHTRVLVVDDSPLMRKQICRLLATDDAFDVVTARDGADALDKIRAHDPHVVTLDINMPVMDGLTCLCHIMEQAPRPVIMLSSLTEKGALASFEALAIGAVDYVAKPSGTVSHDIDRVRVELLRKIHAATGARVGVGRKKDRARRASEPAERVTHRRVKTGGVALVAVSTGGPQTVESILQDIPSNLPASIVIAQHMPRAFTRTFAERLHRATGLPVHEVDRVMPLEVGHVYVARGDGDLTFEARIGRVTLVPQVASSEVVWHPSAERLVRSALDVFEPSRLLGVMLTGMGDDGARAMTDLREGGGYTIAESSSSAVVYGMPRALVDMGGASTVLDRDRIADEMVRWSIAVDAGRALEEHVA